MSIDTRGSSSINLHVPQGSGAYLAGDNNGIFIQHAIDAPTRKALDTIALTSKPLADLLERALEEGVISAEVATAMERVARAINVDVAESLMFAARRIDHDVADLLCHAARSINPTVANQLSQAASTLNDATSRAADLDRLTNQIEDAIRELSQAAEAHSMAPRGSYFRDAGPWVLGFYLAGVFTVVIPLLVVLAHHRH